MPDFHCRYVSRRLAVCNFKVKMVSNRELLLWYRVNISPNLMYLDELGNGVDFCLGIDMLFPGVIGKRIIEVTETAEYFKRLNFRRLQAAFSKLNVKADIPIDGLIKGSFKDLFTFGIWFKAFFEANCKLQPGDLNKVRSSHLKRWVTMKKQYELQKAKLYSQHVAPQDSCASDCEESQVPNRKLTPAMSHVQLRAESPVGTAYHVPNRKLKPVRSHVQTRADSPACSASAEVHEQITWTKTVAIRQKRNIDTRLFTKKKGNGKSEMSFLNNLKKNSDDSDADRQSHVDKSRTEYVTDTLDMALRPYCLKGTLWILIFILFIILPKAM